MPHVPHEVVTAILLRLPVSSLARFSCVCKAWRATISDDQIFRRDLGLHRRQRPCLLIVPRIPFDEHNGRRNKAGFYRWEEAHGAAAIFMHPMELPPAGDALGYAHCDGLVMVATLDMVRVLDPATARVDLTLAWTVPCLTVTGFPAFGLGRDPRTGEYKIVRLFEQTEYRETGVVRTSSVEVFTIGADEHWRQLAVQQPHFAMAWQTAAFFKGSLLWWISRYDPAATTGFLRFRLDEDTFSVIPPPPSFSWWSVNDVPTLSELGGELCAACPRKGTAATLDMWMCTDFDSAAGANMPQWEKRYTIHWDWPKTSLRPVAVLDDAVLVCQASGNRLFRCILQTQKRIEVKFKYHMEGLKYYNLEEDPLLEYPQESMSHFDVIPYVPSSVSI